MAVMALDGDRKGARRAAALVCAYAAGLAYSQFLAGATHNIPSIWTANAVAIAAFLALNRRHVLAFVIASSALHVILQLATGASARFIAMVTVLDTLQAAGAALAMRGLGIPSRVRDPRSLFLIIIVACAATMIGAILVNGLIAASYGHPFFRRWQDWTLSNVLGVALILPVALILMDHRHREGFNVKPLESGATLVLVIATSSWVFFNDAALQVLLFAPALLAAFRGGPRAVAVVITTSLAVAIPAVLQRTGLDIKVALSPLRHALVFHMVLYAVSFVAALALSRQARLQALLVRRQAAARAAQARALAASQAKSDFLATISHEIRTPLNSILGFASLVADDPALSPENRRRLDLVSQAGRSLAEIVGDLLDFAKVEAGRLDLTLTPTAPSALLRDTVAIIAPAAAAKGLTVRTVCDSVGEGDVDMTLALDETRMRQVLLNLLANALKFTAEGGVTVKLTAGPAVGALRFEVIDTGIGIAPDVQDRLFQRFSQADSSTSRHYGGTGLGLAISKALITRMGGAIGVESALGQGARFWVTLNAERCDDDVQAEACGCAGAEPTLERAARVLLVDDHPMNRELGKALLTLAGCETVTADDGAQALEALQVGDFDLVLMDVHMPGMDGLTAARAIRALPGTVSAIPIIALSADVLPEQIARCRQAGMDDHVGKPIHREDLIAAVARALEGRTRARSVETAAKA